MRAYLTILRLPGALAFCAAGLLARAGGAMVGIGIVLMIQSLYGSYGLAGAVSAVNSAGWAIGAAYIANLVDRHGQRRIMLPAAIVSTVMLALLVAAATLHAPAWVLFVPGALSGLTAGSAGGMVRARWNHLLDDPHQLHAAFSLESTLDELTFIVGPVAATALATGVFPASGLLVACVTGIVGAFVFYSLRASEPPAHPVVKPPVAPTTTVPQPTARLRRIKNAATSTAASVTSRLLLAQPGFAPVVAVTMTMGMAFGSIDVTVVAANEAWGMKWAAGPVLAAISLGSAVAGFAYGARRWATSLATRYLVGVIAFGLGASTFLFATSPVMLGVCGFLAGLAIAPSFINANSLVQQLVAEERLTEGLAWVGTAIGIGISVGSSVAGHMIDVFGYHAGFLTLNVVALGGITLVATSTRAIRRRAAEVS